MQRGPGMKPMFLPDVERASKPSPFTNLIRGMQEKGAEYPQIWHLLAYQPKASEALCQFTQEVLRGPAPMSAGIRELIAAFTSYGNDCPF